MTDIPHGLELDELRQRVAAAQRLLAEAPGRPENLPAAIPELRRLVDDLWRHVEAHIDGRARTDLPDRELDARLAKRNSAIIEASLDPIIAADYQGHVVEFNSAAERLFGHTRAQAIGCELAELIAPPRFRSNLRAALAGLRRDGESHWLDKRFETFAVKSDGSEFPLQIAVSRIADEEHPLVVAYLHDITARKQADREVARYQDRLRSLTAELFLAEESERRRLAIDLHDGLSQTLALAKMKLVALPVAHEAALQRPLAEIGELIELANRSVRSITFELSPPVLHDLGLEPAVQWLVEHIQSRYGLDIALEDDGKPKPADDKTRVIMFRSIRELLINIAKHARARRVHVCLKRVENSVEATVDDDGIGMELDGSVAPGSGLLSIRERMNHVGGSMEIDSSRGRGTSICLRAPLTVPGSPTVQVHT